MRPTFLSRRGADSQDWGRPVFRGGSGVWPKTCWCTMRMRLSSVRSLRRSLAWGTEAFACRRRAGL